MMAEQNEIIFSLVSKGNETDHYLKITCQGTALAILDPIKEGQIKYLYLNLTLIFFPVFTFTMKSPFRIMPSYTLHRRDKEEG